jgi:Methane oxygenase PmoA
MNCKLVPPLLALVISSNFPAILAGEDSVELRREGDQIDILIGGRPFATYHFDPAVAKPYLFPLRSAQGTVVTRGFAMVTDIPGEGKMRRDFTISTTSSKVLFVWRKNTQPNPQWDGEGLGLGTSSASYRIYNIGDSKPVELDEFISILEEKLCKKAERILLSMQPGDVPTTFADIEELAADTGFRPRTTLREGISKFVHWYVDCYAPAQSSAARADEGTLRLNLSSGLYA